MGATKEEILKATSGGLDVILDLYPDAQKAVERKGTKFKVRDEKTASASLVNRDGIWYVTDFGGDQKARNAIDCWMFERGKSFKEALDEITDKFGISTLKLKAQNRGPVVRKEKISTSMENGIYVDDSNQIEVTDQDLKDLGRHVTLEAFTELGWRKISRYQVVKDGHITTIEAKDSYPIYEIQYDGFTKIYQPFNKDKQYRFMYTGDRSKKKDYVCGLEILEAEVASKKLQLQADDPEEKKGKHDPRVESVIICSGETDSLSVNSIGFHVLWMNSETQLMTWSQFNKVKELAKNIYYLGDIDATGKRQAIKWGLEHLDLRLIILPDSLLLRTDRRGNPCKDVRDFLKYNSPFAFRQLLNLAYPFKFWDSKMVPSEDGTRKVVSLKFNLAYALNFLQIAGYFQIKHPNSKTGFLFVQIMNNIVRETKIQDIKAFMREFVQQRRMPVEIINLVLRSRDMSENALSNLVIKDVSFSRSGHNFQHFFFDQNIWKITAGGIEEISSDNLEGHIWEDQIIRPHGMDEGEFKPSIDEDYFTVSRDPESGEYDIKVHDQDNPFFQFLINASRVHWKTEMEKAGLEGREMYKPNEELAKLGLNVIDNEYLEDNQIRDHKLHLINKLHVLGHLLHTHKDPSRPWAVWAMDNRISDISESHGRSGKSITFQALTQILKSEYENGRKLDLTRNQFLFENVSEHTDYILIDDANYYLDLNFFYAWITGKMPINPKNSRSYTIPFDKSPKMAFTSNYAPRNRDSSTMGRLYFTVYSDFYHDTSNQNPLPRTPLDDLGIRLFDDFTKEQWNKFYNLMAQCVKLYMQFDKINPPMENVEKRGHLNVMGDNFYHWANDYLMENINDPGVARDAGKYINRKAAKLDYTDYNKKDKAISTQKFNKKVEAWCAFHGLELNPESVQRTDGRVFHTFEGIKEEAFYIEGKKAGNYEDLPFLNDDEPF